MLKRIYYKIYPILIVSVVLYSLLFLVTFIAGSFEANYRDTDMDKKGNKCVIESYAGLTIGHGYYVGCFLFKNRFKLEVK